MKRYGKNILILLLAFVCMSANGQQLPIFSQYVLNGFILNPSMAGYDGYTSVNTTARQQWTGFGQAPQTFSASWQTRILQRSYKIVNHPVRNENLLLPSTKGRVGLGAYIMNDVNGNVSWTGMQFAYAYHLIMNNHQLSFGLAGKVLQFRIAEEELDFGINDDPLQNAGIDDVGYAPDADIGIYFTNTYYFVGLSASNLFQTGIKVGGIDYKHKILRHYWLMAGYKFKVAENLSLEPNALLKTTEKWIPQGDLGIKAYYEDDYWFGLAYRTDKSLIGLLGLRKDGLFFGYAFDFSFTSIQRFNYGTHELSISYKFGTNARRYRWLRRY